MAAEAGDVAAVRRLAEARLDLLNPPVRRPLQGQRSRRRLSSAADGNTELSWSRVAVDRVALQVGETWARVRLMPWPARNL